MGDLNWFGFSDIGDGDNGSVMPSKFTISQNYPNPFNPTTTIVFTIDKTTYTKLVIYNIVGQKVKTLVNKEFIQGVYKETWNGDYERGIKVASVVYFVIMESNGFRASKKMLLVK